MKVKLYMFSGSNAVLTVQLMLNHKGIDYKRVNMPPGVHAPMLLAKGFETMTVPALDVDGRRIQGTRSISRALDELVPEPRLFPTDPERRLAVEEAERWGEQLQDATRRIFYCMARGDRRAFASFTTAGRALPMRCRAQRRRLPDRGQSLRHAALRGRKAVRREPACGRVRQTRRARLSRPRWRRPSRRVAQQGQPAVADVDAADALAAAGLASLDARRLDLHGLGLVQARGEVVGRGDLAERHEHEPQDPLVAD